MAEQKNLKAEKTTSNSKLKWICVTAISTALFVVLTMCLQVPVFENYYLCLGYVIMAVCLYSFGVVSGTFVGVMGGWAIGNLVIGVIVGLTFKFTKKLNKTWLQALINFLAIVVSTAIGILIFKSLTECVLYGQPMIVRMGKNVFAFAADVFMLVFSLPICMSMDKLIKKELKL